MYSSGHINMGTSSDDLFDKSGKNQNSLHYKYNKFLVSPYRPRGYNYYLTSDLPKNSKNNLEFGESKENGLDDSLGETEIYYPKPNNYNSIYTQKFSKKFKKYYNSNPYYLNNQIENYNYSNSKNENNPIILNEKLTTFNTVKTPEYQIKKEIQFQRTPDRYSVYKNNPEYNKYDNYKRYDDYYFPSNKIEQRYNSPVISKIAENNFISQDFNNRYQHSTPGVQNKNRGLYLYQ